MTANARALSLLEALPPAKQLAVAVERLSSGPGAFVPEPATPEVDVLLAGLAVGSELHPDEAVIDGRLLEAVVERGLSGARGAVFTGAAEARLLAALGLARAATRRGIGELEALTSLLGLAAPSPRLSGALEGLRVLDPCCGGAALLVAALALGRTCGADLALAGLDVAPLAASAARARLGLLGCQAAISCADALAAPWPAADLVLANPPFLRHEAMAAADKARATARSGLGRRADLSAHLAMLALRHAPEVALVWPRGLDGARSAAPLRSEAEGRGGFTWRLRSSASGSFAASVDTALVVWSEGAAARDALESAVPFQALDRAALASLAARGEDGASGGPIGRVRRSAAPRGAERLDHACQVRFGMKTGCNAFFHLRPLGGERYQGALAGEVSLPGAALQPVLASLKEVAAPALARPGRHLFRPDGGTAPASFTTGELFGQGGHPVAGGPTAGDRRAAAAGGDPRVAAYLAQGEALGVAARPTCRSRAPWWLVSPGRAPAPVLYPAKVGTRAFAFLNEGALWEDKKWHALFPRPGLPPWLVAAALSSTPVRLAVERGARQLTGAQAIADIDCHVLAGAPFPRREALAAREARLAACWDALARDPVTTDLATSLGRPAQEELDHAVGEALGQGAAEVREGRAELLRHVEARLGHAGQVRAAVAAAARAGGRAGNQK